MEKQDISHNVKSIFSKIPQYNSFGEKVTVVAATKTRSVEEITAAVNAGITDIGENKAQEFRDKFPYLQDVKYHFFGRLQKNKLKYLVGKAYLIQSIDSVDLAKELSVLSKKQNVNSQILLEVNLGEAQKGGFIINELQSAYEFIKTLPNVTVRGLMAVLPDTQDIDLLSEKCLQMRTTYDIMKKTDSDFTVLSMGMTIDYEFCISKGSNMVRIGEGIFGKRIYKEN